MAYDSPPLAISNDPLEAGVIGAFLISELELKMLHVMPKLDRYQAQSLGQSLKGLKKVQLFRVWS